MIYIKHIYSSFLYLPSNHESHCFPAELCIHFTTAKKGDLSPLLLACYRSESLPLLIRNLPDEQRSHNGIVLPALTLIEPADAQASVYEPSSLQHQIKEMP